MDSGTDAYIEEIQLLMNLERPCNDGDQRNKSMLFTIAGAYKILHFVAQLVTTCN